MPQDEQENAITAKTRKKYLWNLQSLSLALMILTLILIVGGGFWSIFNLGRQVTTSLSSFSQQIEADQQQITLLQTKLATAEQQLQQQVDSFQEWRRSVQKGHDDGQVLNAQYWVQRAMDYLLLTSDVPRALRLLNQAQDELKGLTDPRISALQKALDEDLATLKNVPWVDSAELYLSLVTLKKQIDKLPLVLVPTQNKIMLPSAEAVPISMWGRGWQEFKSALRQMVVVYHSPAASVVPFITPDESPYIYQNIMVSLNGAMWAVLYRDNNIYHSSLQQASGWIQQYFDPNAAFSKTVLTELQTLQMVSLHPAKELILVSPRVFQDYLKTA